MIGNDVVDLSCARKQSNWKRKGYLDKIYTASEQVLVYSAANPDAMVWLLWTMKEASYKANQRITGIKEYAPIKIKCAITHAENDIYWGLVMYNHLAFFTKTYVLNDYIHTIALYNSENFEVVEEILIKNYPVDYVRYLKDKNYFMPSSHIEKDEFGIPSLFDKISKESKPISISHHGNFLSLVFIKD